eukprot:35847_1
MKQFMEDPDEQPSRRSSRVSDDQESVIGSVLSSVHTITSGLTSNTLLQPNFVADRNIITAMGDDENNNNNKKTDDNVSTTQSEFDYLQNHFPQLDKKDIAILYAQSDISTNTGLTASALNQPGSMLNHPKLITTGMPPPMYAPINSKQNKNAQNNNNNNHRISESESNTQFYNEYPIQTRQTQQNEGGG